MEGILRFKIFSSPEVCLKNEIFLYRLKKSSFSISKKKQTKNTQQIAKSHELPGINSLSPVIAPERLLLSFLSCQAHFASCHQCCCWSPAATFRSKRYNNYIEFFYISNGSFQLFNQSINENLYQHTYKLEKISQMLKKIFPVSTTRQEHWWRVVVRGSFILPNKLLLRLIFIS